MKREMRDKAVELFNLIWADYINTTGKGLGYEYRSTCVNEVYFIDETKRLLRLCERIIKKDCERIIEAERMGRIIDYGVIDYEEI